MAMPTKRDVTMRRILLLLMLLLPLCMVAQTRKRGVQPRKRTIVKVQKEVTIPVDTLDHEVLFQTTKGDIKLLLYKETPRHKNNFMKLVREGFFDGTLFHRVIANFMIQGGDSTTRHARPGEPAGLFSPDYTIPAEILYPKFFHKRGALAAAREGDADNPERASSASQFYIVYGDTYTNAQLDHVQEKLDVSTQGKVKLTPAVRDYYRLHGGTPHLDGQYTVFGEVEEGLDVVRDIDSVKTDAASRPLEDVRIIKATLIR